MTSVDCLIPCWNYGRFLADAVESVLGQTAPYSTVLVVDDASTDRTPRVLAELCARWPGRIQVARNDRRMGVAALLNRWLPTLPSAWWNVISADDWIPPEWLERHVAVIEATAEPRLAIAYAPARYTSTEPNDAEGHHGSVIANQEWSHERLQVGNFITGSAVFLADAFREVEGFALDVNREEDHDLWRRMAARGWTGELVHGTVLNYRLHAGGQRNWGTDGKRVGLVD